MDNSNTGCSKFTRPSVRDVVPRQRLFKTLASGKNYSAIWLAGPPGSGKTTLVADYLNSLNQPCIWYRVDQGDADIATFFHYFTQAANQWILLEDYSSC